MAITQRAITASSLAAGTSVGGQLTVTGPEAGEQGYLTIQIANSSVIAVTTAGWTQVGSQQALATGAGSAALFRRTFTGDEDVVAWTVSPTGTRWSATLTIVKGANVPEGPVYASDSTDDATIGIPQITPTFNDAFVLALFAGSLTQTASPSIAAPADWAQIGSSFTTNGTGRISSSWSARRQRAGGAGVATTATSATASSTGLGAVWVYAFEAAPVPTLNYQAATATGWTVVGGGTALGALSDQNDSTLLRYDNPTAGQVLGPLTLSPQSKPTGDWTVPLRAYHNGTSGSVVAKLYSSTNTLIATSPSVSFGTSVAGYAPTFTAASLSATTSGQWTAGTMTVRYEFTAA